MIKAGTMSKINTIVASDSSPSGDIGELEIAIEAERALPGRG